MRKAFRRAVFLGICGLVLVGCGGHAPSPSEASSLLEKHVEGIRERYLDGDLAGLPRDLRERASGDPHGLIRQSVQAAKIRSIQIIQIRPGDNAGVVADAVLEIAAPGPVAFSTMVYRVSAGFRLQRVGTFIRRWRFERFEVPIIVEALPGGFRT